MISWTLDNTTFHYWTLNETGEVIWGYPKHGDEVIIDDRFKYIFKSSVVLDSRLKTFQEIADRRFGVSEDDTIRVITNETLPRGFQIDTNWLESINQLGVAGTTTLSATISQNPGEEVVLSNVRYNVIEPTNDLVSDLDNDQADEISTYMREAQQMMNNGR